MPDFLNENNFSTTCRSAFYNQSEVSVRAVVNELPGLMRPMRRLFDIPGIVNSF